MSATEIIEQIKQLPREEQQKVAAFIHAAEDSGAFQKVSDEFRQMADKMFATNAELFRKLAQ